MKNSVSTWDFLFQSAFLPLKSAKITVFLAPRGVMTNAAYIENGVGGIFLLCSIVKPFLQNHIFALLFFNNMSAGFTFDLGEA